MDFFHGSQQQFITQIGRKKLLGLNLNYVSLVSCIINKNSLCFPFDHFQLFNMNAGLEAPLYGNKRC